MQGTLHFIVKGEFITDFARKRYKETNDPSVGIGILTKSLVGFPEDLARDVIFGKKKLVGINDIFIEDDNQCVIPYGVIQPNDIHDVECGWIAPDGSIYGHKIHNRINDHIELAKQIVESFHFQEKHPDGHNFEYILESEGFLKFDPILVCGYGEFTPTEAQKDVVAAFTATRTSSRISLGFHGRFFTSSAIRSMDKIQFRKHVLDI